MSPVKARVQPRRSISNGNNIASSSSSPITIKTATTTSSTSTKRIRIQRINQIQDVRLDIQNESSEAGPSSSKTSALSISKSKPSLKSITNVKQDVKGKGKEKPPERRVLPPRIRRSTGGGESMREVEEMIIDWLERCSEPSITPPDNLPIYLTSIPLSYVDPPVTQISFQQQRQQQHSEEQGITLTPNSKKSIKNPEDDGQFKEKIEVPEWVMVKAGEDDEEEAREELVFGNIANNNKGKGKVLVSPVKRLRRGGIGDELEEDTSDSYYISLHRKYEIFEKRQRIREKEKLQFERYKMKSRLELLKNLPKLTWSTILSTILQRSLTNYNLDSTITTKIQNDEKNDKDDNQASNNKVNNSLQRGGEKEKWLKGKQKIKEKGDDWLKRQLIKEGEEVMQRFDELLPPEQRKPKNSVTTSQNPESRLSTPSTRISSSPSLTPPPIVLPARVAALRDPPSTSTSSANKRKRKSSIILTPIANKSRSTKKKNIDQDHDMENDSPSRTRSNVEIRKSTRVLRTYGKRNRSESISLLDDSSSATTALSIHDSESDEDEYNHHEDEDEPVSSQEIIKSSSTKTRKAVVRTESPPEVVEIMNPPHQSISKPTLVSSSILPPPPLPKIQPKIKSKPINHTQQSIKAFFTPPKKPVSPLIAIKPLSLNGGPQTALPHPTPKTSTVRPSTTLMINPVKNPMPSPSSSPPQPFYPPITVSGLPCLIEAASKRESLNRGNNMNETIVIDDDMSDDLPIPQKRVRTGSRSSKRDDITTTNGNGVLNSTYNPFGVALPGRLEWKSEFTISDEEDFWPIIANREEINNQRRKANVISTASSRPGAGSSIDIGMSVNGISDRDFRHISPIHRQQQQQQKPDNSVLTPEEFAELEGVEEAVVL
ncbi:uncharacterized protein L201_007634 [Kwoniella dendrophila CBS 6074]|uniref:Something about silencing protein 4 domain-containing protein n=1 Tax=Kwoniella dendrophila CBS 6074 TaxID=1295534 RepID=A0AAX4K791_9TREE